MTYKEQYKWLTENSFHAVGCSGNSMTWRKEYETFTAELWRRNSGGWELSVVDWTGLEDIPLFSLPDDFDFNKLTPLIKCYDELSTI